MIHMLEDFTYKMEGVNHPQTEVSWVKVLNYVYICTGYIYIFMFIHTLKSSPPKLPHLAQTGILGEFLAPIAYIPGSCLWMSTLFVRGGVLKQTYPIGSMYGIFTYIGSIFMVNVGKHTIVPWILWVSLLRPPSPIKTFKASRLPPAEPLPLSRSCSLCQLHLQGQRIHGGLIDMDPYGWNGLWTHVI